MIVQLDEAVTAEVVLGHGLRMLPRWDLNSRHVWLGPYHSAHEWVLHSVEAVGSSDVDSFEQTDELAFDKAALLLQSASFIVSDHNLTTTPPLAIWQNTPPVWGLLRLTASSIFRIRSTSWRWFANDGTQLAGFTDAALVESTARLRLRIAQDVDILFIGGKLCGWLLSRPERYLIIPWDDPYPYPEEPDKTLVEALRQYMDLVGEPKIELLEARDRAAFEILAALHNELNPEEGARGQRRVLRNVIEDIADYFYRQKLVHT